MTHLRGSRWAALLIVLAVAGCQSAGNAGQTSMATATSAAPAPTNPGSDALFYTKAGSLYVSAPAGAPGRKLTDGPADFQPAPSPDLARVAFVRKTDAADYGGEVWVLDLSAALEPLGSARRLVDPTALPQGTTGTPPQLAFPRWSPAGGQVAFLHNPTEGAIDGGSLLVASAEDGALARRPPQSPETAWAPFAASTFAWSPDGSRIAWLDQRSDVRPTNVNTLDAATGEFRPVIRGTNASSVTFSRDGETILFTNGESPPDFALSTGGIYSVPASGDAETPTAVFTGKGTYLSDLAMLDSGAMAFAVASPNSPPSTIQVLDKGSTTPRTMVTDISFEPICHTTPRSGGVCHGVPRPAWGAGDLLAYLDSSPEPSLTVTDADNTSPRRVDMDVETFAWAPRAW